MVLNVDKEKEKIAPGPQAKTALALGTRRGEVSHQHPRQGHRHEHHVLRCFREARRRRRRPGAHLRNELDQAHQPPQRNGQRRRGNRRGGPGRQQDQTGNLAGHEADRSQPLDPARREISPGHRHHRQGPQPRPTTAPSSRSKKASTACCTSAICRGPRKSPTPANSSRRATRFSALSSASIRKRTASRWASSR